MEVHEAILSRRTIKDFRPEPVPENLLERALAAGLLAQNHRLTQPWRFTVFGRETHRALAETAPDVAKILSKPVVVAVSCVLSGDESQHWEDELAVACAIQNIQLVAWAEGLGMQWSTAAFGRADSAYRLLGLDPAAEKIIGLLFFGFPARVPPAQPRKGLPEVMRRLP